MPNKRTPLSRPKGTVCDCPAAQLLLIMAVLILLLGCQPYTFNPRGKPTVKSIAIERFENNTAEFALSDRMTTIVTERFISDGTLAVLPATDAEAILSGTLIRYDRKPYDYDGNDQVTKYAIYMDFEIRLRSHTDNTELLKERLNQVGVYTVDGETEEDGQTRALQLLVDAIFDKITKSW